MVGAGTIYCNKKAHKAHTNDLEKGPTKDELRMVLENDEVRSCEVPMEDKKTCEIDM